MIDLIEVTEEEKARYDESLAEHIANTKIAGKQLGVDEEQLEQHDLSKWDDEEYYAYTKQFQGGGCPEYFPSAWLHHIQQNEHHWEHWIFPKRYSYKRKGSEVFDVGDTVYQSRGGLSLIEMPEKYVREMVADWLGASMTYTGSWDMTDWLRENLKDIELHPNSVEMLISIMGSIGYKLEYSIGLDGELIELID